MISVIKIYTTFKIGIYVYTNLIYGFVKKVMSFTLFCNFVVLGVPGI